ncbi:ORF030 [Staphylococcus phage 47]|uniref:ORF030 n=1 Tax=Staphylococcus phage 47 TaxID=2936812 RepID=Q4ZCI9_9CAUD|nr:ORF030 [Staphylococcus phage 47]
MAGRTSDVTQRLNRFADSSFDEKIKLYKPDSLTAVSPRFGKFSKVVFRDVRISLSSSSTCLLNASRVFEYPKISATSLPTKYGSLSTVNVLTGNSSKLNVCNACICLCLLKRLLGHQFSKKNIVHFFSG